MPLPSGQPGPAGDTLAHLAELVSDHEKRIRKVERVLWAAAGAASGSTGTWLTIILMRR